MNLFFKNIVSDILTEGINASNAGDAIRHRNEVEITYSGDDGGKRIIQPVAYGLSKAGNMVLRAFQPFGTTKTKVPHWKLFRMDKIDSWKQLRGRIFSEPPGQYNSADGKFNPNGDESMSEVYLVANFERSKDYHSGKQYGGLKKYNDQRAQRKKEEDPFNKFRQNVTNSYISKDVKDRIEKYPSKAARDYVKGNERYQQDMFRVNNSDDNEDVTQNTPVTKESPNIRKQEKNTTYNKPENINIPLNNVDTNGVEDENKEDINNINNNG